MKDRLKVIRLKGFRGCTLLQPSVPIAFSLIA
jgi:hypothetical protein